MRLIIILLVSVSLFSCVQEGSKTIISEPQPRDSVKISLTEYSIPGTNIRALAVLNDSTVWFAGSNGKWGFTENNGKDWKLDSLTFGDKPLHFRSIVVNPNGAFFLVSITNPAVVFKSADKGENWKVVYTDTTKNAFFDAIDFWDNQNGLLLGDVQNGCFHFAVTNNGGDTWQKVDCSDIPIALSEENPFAASNTNIALSGKHAWIGTGGKSGARVYHTPNFGKTWEVQNTSVVFGKTMTGIYSIDFYNDLMGIVAGGNWDSVAEKTTNMAITKDGGQTWNALENSAYVSCVQFIPGGKGKEVFALSGRMRDGESSMRFSGDGGQTWQFFANENYVSLKFANKNVAWISGKEKIAKLILE